MAGTQVVDGYPLKIHSLSNSNNIKNNQINKTMDIKMDLMSDGGNINCNYTKNDENNENHNDENYMMGMEINIEVDKKYLSFSPEQVRDIKFNTKCL